MNTVIITMESVTQAVRARKTLARMKIRSKLVKIDASRTLRGCTYGLEFPAPLLRTVSAELRKLGIAYEIYPQDRKR